MNFSDVYSTLPIDVRERLSKDLLTNPGKLGKDLVNMLGPQVQNLLGPQAQNLINSFIGQGKYFNK